MIRFKTSSGWVSVDNWGYELQGLGGKPLSTSALASATHDLKVMDSTHDGRDATAFTADELTRIKDGMGGRSVVVSYISIGEASDFRNYWHKDWTITGKATGTLTDAAPDWLGPLNPDWPESRKVRYWDKDWQETVFNSAHKGDLDKIVAAGFDAAYLDIVDAYYFWGAEVKAADRAAGDPKTEKQAAQRMVDFVVAMASHARETNPDFFLIPQNGAAIIDALKAGTPDTARIEAYRDAIGGIAIEDLYYRGDRDENNGLQPDSWLINVLKRDYLSKGIPVFVVDYLNDKTKVKHFNELALKDGFIPFAAPHRDLDQLVGTHDGDPAFIKPTAGNDALRGSKLADVIDGLAGNDGINGRAGNDRLAGGLGVDSLTGGAGKDVFVFASVKDSGKTAASRDTIVDFVHGSDRMDLHRMDAKSASAGDDAFSFVAKEGAAFSRHAGELVWDQTKDKGARVTVISGDVDGDGKADFQIELTGHVALSAGDFVL